MVMSRGSQGRSDPSFPQDSCIRSFGAIPLGIISSGSKTCCPTQAGRGRIIDRDLKKYKLISPKGSWPGKGDANQDLQDDCEQSIYQLYRFTDDNIAQPELFSSANTSDKAV